MVISCCAVGCSNRQGYKANVAFYRIPADEDKRRLWLAAINRKEWQPSKYTRICSEHFLQGQKSDNPLSPNYVPSVFAHIKSPAKRRALGSLKKYEARQAMKKKKREESSRHEAARSLLNLSAEVSGSVFVADGEETEKEPANNDIIDNSKCDAMCQTELTSENIRSLQFECQQLRDKTFALQEKLNSDILEQASLKRLQDYTAIRKTFQSCMPVIDCFEIAVENPKDLKARARTYSQYKSKKTMKYLMGISPQEVISFISKGWGGRTTDAHITANSGFLDNLLPGDLILADRGFTIQNQVGLHCAKVEAPASSRGKKQLGAVELEDSRKLAATC
ncbi:uncharacterized protein [Nothobranchius furzeri]